MKAYLIPGNGEGLKDRDYRAVLDMYKSLGYDPEFVPLKWAYKTIDDWVEEIKTKIPKNQLAGSLLSGFSFGAMIATAVAAQTNPKKLLLFSLSPYFKEDFPIPKDYEVYAGKRKIENFKRLSFNSLAAQIKCPTLIFVGSQEIAKYHDTDFRSEEAKRQIKNSKLYVVEGAGHDVGAPRYVETIRNALS